MYGTLKDWTKFTTQIKDKTIFFRNSTFLCSVKFSINLIFVLLILVFVWQPIPFRYTTEETGEGSGCEQSMCGVHVWTWLRHSSVIVPLWPKPKVYKCSSSVAQYTLSDRIVFSYTTYCDVCVLVHFKIPTRRGTPVNLHKIQWTCSRTNEYLIFRTLKIVCFLKDFGKRDLTMIYRCKHGHPLTPVDEFRVLRQTETVVRWFWEIQFHESQLKGGKTITWNMN